jgi:hypothetical protein
LVALSLILFGVWVNTYSETAGGGLRTLWVGTAWLSLAAGVGLLLVRAYRSARKVGRP